MWVKMNFNQEKYVKQQFSTGENMPITFFLLKIITQEKNEKYFHHSCYFLIYKIFFGTYPWKREKLELVIPVNHKRKIIEK